MRTKIIYIDMDGVLAKWCIYATLKDVATPGYFVNREPDWVIINAIKMLRALGFTVVILSAVYQDGHSAGDKRTWLKKVGLGEFPYIFVPYGEAKGDYVGKGNILIDDFTDNLLGSADGRLPAWCGIPVKYYNGINGTKGRYQGYSVRFDMTSEQIAETIAAIAA